MEKINDKQYLTSLDGYAVFSGDVVFLSSKEEFIQVIAIGIEKDGRVKFITDDESVRPYIQECLHKDLAHLYIKSRDGNVHVDDFIESLSFDSSKDRESEIENYAKFFFMLHRLPAYMKNQWEVIISKYKLYCLYEGKAYRVTGASRMGDIWLTSDMKQEHGYELRVFVNQVTFSNFE